MTISSPEPTITALIMSPGPSCRRMPAKSVGAGLTSAEADTAAPVFSSVITKQT